MAVLVEKILPQIAQLKLSGTVVCHGMRQTIASAIPLSIVCLMVWPPHEAKLYSLPHLLVAIAIDALPQSLSETGWFSVRVRYWRRRHEVLKAAERPHAELKRHFKHEQLRLFVRAGSGRLSVCGPPALLLAGLLVELAHFLLCFAVALLCGRSSGPALGPGRR